MLLSFRVENHKSIREEQQLLLTPVYDDARPREADWEAATVAGVFGANASGKSNLLDALALMRDTVRWSMSDNEPGAGMRRHAFALDPECQNEPSTFVVDLMLGGVRHTYGFSIDDDHVVEEWLYSYPKRRKRVLFERDGAEFSLGDAASAELRQIEAITGPNVLFLTVAARAGREAVESVYRWFSQSLVFASERRSEQPEWLSDRVASAKYVGRLNHLLRSAGTGIQRIEIGESEQIPFRERYMAAVEGSARTSSQVWKRALHTLREASESQRLGKGSHQQPQLPLFMEGSSTILFHHGGGAPVRPLAWEEESLGTRSLATMGFEAHRALEMGGVLVVDEIDASLHPYLSAKVISLFQDEEQNPKGAQLLFTSHDAALLGRIRGEEVLRRDHVWFVDKDDLGQTSLYPLSDFKPRGDDNRARRYLTGRYGAVPEVDDELFRDALHRRERETEDAARRASDARGSRGRPVSAADVRTAKNDVSTSSSVRARPRSATSTR